MTCIVGIVDKINDCVLIGGDSAGVAGNSITIRKDTKVFKVGDFVIGCTSSFRMIQLLQYSFNPPEINDKNIHEYLCTDFVDSIRKCFKDGGYLRTSNDVESGGSFLVGYKNRLFSIDDDFQVGETNIGYHSVGCGDDYACGSLYSTQNMENYHDRLILALESAEFHSTGVAKPFIILSTK